VNDHFEPLGDVWPRFPEAIKDRRLNAKDVEEAVKALGGEVWTPPGPASQSDPRAETQVMVPGTNLHVRLPSAARGLLQLAWVAFKGHLGTTDPGDAFSVMTAVDKLKKAFQTLNAEAGEKCVCLAIGKATVNLGLFKKEYPTTEQIAEAVRRNKSWCGNSCVFHRADAQEIKTETVRSILQGLKTRGEGVVTEMDDDRWSIRF
jgi:hypothetical protein